MKGLIEFYKGNIDHPKTSEIYIETIDLLLSMDETLKDNSNGVNQSNISVFEFELIFEAIQFYIDNVARVPPISTLQYQKMYHPNKSYAWFSKKPSKSAKEEESI